MVMINTRPLNIKAADLAAELAQKGIKVSIYGLYTIRLVTNKDVDRDDILLTIDAFKEIIKELF